jgi:glucosamine kinase
MGSDVVVTFEYLVGVDGGGTGTRVRVERPDGALVARGVGGPSGLMHGSDQAWAAILDALNAAFAEAGLVRPDYTTIAIGLGLAGVHNQRWAAEFREKNPGFGALQLETDAYTTVLGAHMGGPGAIISIGTGSVGEALLPDGTRREVGGFGFPAGDEGAGDWLGLRAISHGLRVLDGRDLSGNFAQAVIDFCGGDRNGVNAWLADATQTTFAQLAPIVIQYAPTDDAARNILIEAGMEIAKFGAALDATGQLPIALCGGLAEPLREYLPEQFLARVVKPHADSVAGALLLIRRSVEGKQ